MLSFNIYIKKQGLDKLNIRLTFTSTKYTDYCTKDLSLEVQALLRSADTILFKFH